MFLQRLKLQMAVLVIIIPLLLLVAAVPTPASAQAKSGCRESCGNLTNIPYPFGTTPGCYYSEAFLITCNESDPAQPQPFLGDSNIDITNISLDGQLYTRNYVARDCYDRQTNLSVQNNDPWFSLKDFVISDTKNKFTAIGCDTYAYINDIRGDKTYGSGCISICSSTELLQNGTCSGIGCCQTAIPKGVLRTDITLTSYYNHTRVMEFNPCSYAFIVQEDKFKFSTAYLERMEDVQLPLVLDWAIGNESCEVGKRNSTSYACKEFTRCEDVDNGYGYRCKCLDGYQGNPYLPNGCQDINECEQENDCEKKCENKLGTYTCTCPKGYHGDGRKSGKGCTADQLIQVIVLGTITGFGILFLLLGTWWIYKIVRKRNKMKLKQNYFKRNGGFLLQKQLTYGEEGNVEKTKHFTSKELEKATDNYNENRILGHGGQGTVYKGMLIDGRIVAVKKSTKVNEVQLDQFINEVVILSQIIHRNVVKLHGCCLETEVPLLVYEFIPNGTLFQYIHDQNEDFPLTWDVRLRIATEVAAALSYLHYDASLPIYHRDIKSTNILLDDKYRAKVADFGTSRLLVVDQTHLTTRVLGTFGYLDPEYFQTSQFTEKSDVYSFAVVLVELLTGKNPISLTMSDEMRSLATYFKLAMEENRIFDIIDERVRNESRKEEIIGVANLARRCLSMNGRNRPTMKEVAMELEAIRMSNGASTIQQHYEDVDYDIIEFPRSWETASTSNSTVHLDIQPLLVENLD